MDLYRVVIVDSTTNKKTMEHVVDFPNMVTIFKDNSNLELIKKSVINLQLNNTVKLLGKDKSGSITKVQ